jgi:membrane protein DedA with SNARE-associated domain
MSFLLQAATTHPGALSFLQRLWAYLTLGATGIITEEATPLIGGLAAQTRTLQITAVGLWIAGGTWVADLGLYYIGRLHGHWARKRWPRIRTVMLTAFKIVRRHPWRASVAVRWAFGLRLTLPIACGAARVPLFIYAVGSAISCLTWSFAFVWLGWAFGHTVLIVLGHVRRYEKYLIAVIVLVIFIAFRVMRRKHVEDEVVEVLAKGDTGPIPRVSRPE